MSSLLQFDGKITKAGVHLIAYLIKKVPYDTIPNLYRDTPVEMTPCSICKKQHEKLYTFVRKPRGMWGWWVVFHYNGEDQLPDLSIPISLYKLPRDARPMDQEEAEKYWHT